MSKSFSSNYICRQCGGKRAPEWIAGRKAATNGVMPRWNATGGVLSSRWYQESARPAERRVAPSGTFARAASKEIGVCAGRGDGSRLQHPVYRTVTSTAAGYLREQSV